MKILFILNDGWAHYMNYEHTGVLNNPNRRAVEIELTDEQIKKIGLKQIGTDCGKPVYETIESVSTMDN